jgi:DNA invertase Pin-like site-specific DNA recombinase
VLVITRLSHAMRSLKHLLALADQLRERGVGLVVLRQQIDTTTPTGWLVFDMLAVFAEFEADLLRMRTREGMAIARSRGRLKGKKPKVATRQQADLVRMHATGDYTIAELMEVFSVGRATVYRVLDRAGAGPGTGTGPPPCPTG